MIIGKFQRDDSGLVGTIVGFASRSGPHPPHGSQGHRLHGDRLRPRPRRCLEEEKRQRERLSVDQARQSVSSDARQLCAGNAVRWLRAHLGA